MAEWTAQTIAEWLKTVDPGNPKHQQSVGKALLLLYSRQTSDEQQSGYTKHNNGMGFNGFDAEFLSSVAQKFSQYKRLTPRQTACVAKALIKYSNQLAEARELVSTATVNN